MRDGDKRVSVQMLGMVIRKYVHKCEGDKVRAQMKETEIRVYYIISYHII